MKARACFRAMGQRAASLKVDPIDALCAWTATNPNDLPRWVYAAFREGWMDQSQYRQAVNEIIGARVA